MLSYTLPELPYDYSALDPHYSARLLQLHHDRHHAVYVSGANATLDKLAEAGEKSDFAASINCRETWPFTSPAMCCIRCYGAT